MHLSFSLSRLLQQKFFIRANKTEVKPKSSEQSTASSSKKSKSSTLRKRGEKTTDSPRAKKVNRQSKMANLHVHVLTFIFSCLIVSHLRVLIVLLPLSSIMLISSTFIVYGSCMAGDGTCMHTRRLVI